MSKKQSLKGKTVTLYMDGGWEFTGIIKNIDNNKFIIESNGSLTVIFKAKISCMTISKEERAVYDSGEVEVRTEPLQARRVEAAEVPPADSRFPMNRLSYEETTMSIPGDLLGESGQNMSDDDLSVFYPGGAKITDYESSAGSGMSFGVEEDDSKE
jgi:sRNA-binding regulator protein Hfq